MMVGGAARAEATGGDTPQMSSNSSSKSICRSASAISDSLPNDITRSEHPRTLSPADAMGKWCSRVALARTQMIEAKTRRKSISDAPPDRADERLQIADPFSATENTIVECVWINCSLELRTQSLAVI